MNTYTEALDIAVEAALKAGRLIRDTAGQLSASAVREKNTHDLVTEVDEAAQALIIEKLSTWNADATIIAEEGDYASWVEKATGYRWIIDPVDGTTNFTHGFPPYSVSIGLEYNGELVDTHTNKQQSKLNKYIRLQIDPLGTRSDEKCS